MPCVALGLTLLGNWDKETTDTHAELLGSGGSDAVMETHQQPESLAYYTQLGAEAGSWPLSVESVRL